MEGGGGTYKAEGGGPTNSIPKPAKGCTSFKLPAKGTWNKSF